MSEKLLREFVKASLLAERRMTKKSVATAIISQAPSLFKQGSKSGQVRIGPTTKEASREIAQMEQSAFIDILTRAGFVVTDVYDRQDSKNTYSKSFTAYIVHPEGDEKQLIPVVFSKLGSTPVSIQNERDLVSAVNEHASKESPITVVVGPSWRQPDVVGAEPAGQTSIEVEQEDGSIRRETSKADVNFFTKDGDVVRVSVKMANAQYWLSGDRKLKTKTLEVISDLLSRQSPGVRVVRDADKINYSLVIGDPPKKTDAYFELTEEEQEAAVFGGGSNPIDVVVRGDFITRPAWNADAKTLTWAAGKTYTEIGDLPASDQPVGLLRTGESTGREDGKRRGVKGYPGIRPAIVARARAKNAIKV